MSSDLRRAAPIAGLVALLVAPGARADGPDAVASELFRQGRALIKLGKWDEGCPKLEASMKRFPAASTQLNLALCAEQEGKVATAWAMARRARVLNRETVGRSRREKLDDVAADIVARLDARLPRLRVNVVPEVEGTKVTGDGGELPLGVAVPLDPGPHALTISAPGRESVARSVTLKEGETLALEVSLPETTSVAPPPEPAPEPDPPAPVPLPQPVAPTPAPEGGTPLWAWITGGGGLVFAGLSVGFAVDAAAIAADLEERCGDDLICDEDLSFDPEPDNRRKNVRTGLAIGFGAGGVIALTAAVVGLVVGADEPSPLTSWVSPSGGGLGYRGAF